jgi:hypothetical protein
MAQSFTLVPFEPEQAICTISGTIEYTEPGLLVLQYQFFGELKQVVWPAATNKPQRKDELWQQTCMELFIAEPDGERYFEFNFSPSSDWQGYEFLSYRSLASQPKNIKPPKIDKLDDRTGVSYSVSLDITPLSLTTPLQLGISAVLLQACGDLAYFSLYPQTDAPDFHFRDGFKLTLE